MYHPREIPFLPSHGERQPGVPDSFGGILGDFNRSFSVAPPLYTVGVDEHDGNIALEQLPATEPVKLLPTEMPPTENNTGLVETWGDGDVDIEGALAAAASMMPGTGLMPLEEQVESAADSTNAVVVDEHTLREERYRRLTARLDAARTATDGSEQVLMPTPRLPFSRPVAPGQYTVTVPKRPRVMQEAPSLVEREADTEEFYLRMRLLRQAPAPVHNEHKTPVLYEEAEAGTGQGHLDPDESVAQVAAVQGSVSPGSALFQNGSTPPQAAVVSVSGASVHSPSYIQQKFQEATETLIHVHATDRNGEAHRQSRITKAAVGIASWLRPVLATADKLVQEVSGAGNRQRMSAHTTYEYYLKARIDERKQAEHLSARQAEDFKRAQIEEIEQAILAERVNAVGPPTGRPGRVAARAAELLGEDTPAGQKLRAVLLAGSVVVSCVVGAIAGATGGDPDLARTLTHGALGGAVGFTSGMLLGRASSRHEIMTKEGREREENYIRELMYEIRKLPHSDDVTVIGEIRAGTQAIRREHLKQELKTAMAGAITVGGSVFIGETVGAVWEGAHVSTALQHLASTQSAHPTATAPTPHATPTPKSTPTPVSHSVSHNTPHAPTHPRQSTNPNVNTYQVPYKVALQAAHRHGLPPMQVVFETIQKLNALEHGNAWGTTVDMHGVTYVTHNQAIVDAVSQHTFDLGILKFFG